MTDAAAALRSYRTGEWYAVLGTEVAVLLPPSERARVAALWELVDGGADVDEVLDALITGGLRALPGFVLVADAGHQVRILLRGPARAGIDTFDGPVALDGSDATTWVERVLPGVRALRVDVGDPTPEEGLDRLVDEALVRAGRIDRPPYAEPEPTPERTPVVAAPEPEPEPEPVVEPEPEPVVEPEPEPVVEPEPEPAVEEDDPVVEDEPWYAEEPTEAIDVSELQALGFQGEPLDHDGTTRTSSDDFARDQPGIPGQPPAPSVTARPVARLTFSSGEVVDVDRVVLVGRAPEARRFTVTDQPRLVTVPSPHQEISSTHLEIRPGSGVDHGSAVVTDLGSTNGTVLVQPGLPPEVVQPGVAIQLLPGAVVDLGDGVTIRVENP